MVRASALAPGIELGTQRPMDKGKWGPLSLLEGNVKEQGRSSFWGGGESQPRVHFSVTCSLCDLELFLDFSKPSFSLVKEGNWQDAKV